MSASKPFAQWKRTGYVAFHLAYSKFLSGKLRLASVGGFVGWLVIFLFCFVL